VTLPLISDAKDADERADGRKTTLNATDDE
jgi:hypothetical protein